MKVSELTTRYTALLAQSKAKIRESEDRENNLRGQVAQLRRMADVLEAEADATKSERCGAQTVSWVDEIIRPMAESIAKRKGKKAEVLGPQGIAAKVTIIFHNRDDGGCFMEWSEKEVLTLEPKMRSNEPWLYYETGEMEERYPSGSLGAMNGFNYATAKLPDDEDDIAALFRGEPCWKEMEGGTK